MALGKLVVSVSANITQFSSAMDKAAFQADKSMTGITRSVGLAGAAIAVLGAKAAIGLQQTIMQAIQFGDEIDKAATKAGIAASTMSELAVAAGYADVDINSLSESLKKLQINLSQAASGAKSQNETLRALGLSIKDISDLSADRQFEVIAEQISKIRDPADKARAAVELFGKSGANLLPLFDQGARGIQRAREEAVRTGAALTDAQVKAAADADASIKRLTASWKGFAGTLVTIVEPALSLVARTLTKALSPPSPEGMIKTYEAMLESLKFASDKSETSEYRRIERLLLAARKQAAERVKIAEEAEARIRAATEGKTPEGFENEDARRERERRAKDAETALNRLINERKGILDGLEATYTRLLLTAEEISIVELSRRNASAEELARAVALTDAIRDRRLEQEELKRAEEESKRVEQERQGLLQQWPDLWFNAASSAEQYRIELERLATLADKLIDAGIEQEKVNEFVARSQEKIVQRYDDLKKVAIEFGDAITSSFEEAILSGRNLSDVFKGLLQDILAIIIRLKVTEPLGQAIAGSLGGGGGGFLESIFGAVFGGIFGGGRPPGPAPSAPTSPATFSGPRALGGRVMAGNAYLVGELGPELFVPRQEGEILDGEITSGIFGGGARSVTVVKQTFNISTPDADSFRLSQKQLSRRARVGINV